MLMCVVCVMYEYIVVPFLVVRSHLFLQIVFITTVTSARSSVSSSRAVPCRRHLHVNRVCKGVTGTCNMYEGSSTMIDVSVNWCCTFTQFVLLYSVVSCIVDVAACVFVDMN